MKRYGLDELREEAEAWLDYRSSDHAPGTVSVDRTKIMQFLDWLDDRAADGS
jgi:hypothetical protein